MFGNALIVDENGKKMKRNLFFAHFGFYAKEPEIYQIRIPFLISFLDHHVQCTMYIHSFPFQQQQKFLWIQLWLSKASTYWVLSQQHSFMKAISCFFFSKRIFNMLKFHQWKWISFIFHCELTANCKLQKLILNLLAKRTHSHPNHDDLFQLSTFEKKCWMDPVAFLFHLPNELQ